MSKASGKDGAGTSIGSSMEQLEAYRAGLAKESTESLMDKLKLFLNITVEKLIQVASVVYELERRGKDLSSLKIGLIPYLRKIARGELLPELVVKYSGEPRSLQKVAKLPVEVQKEIYNGKRDFIPAVKVRGNSGVPKVSGRSSCKQLTKEEEEELELEGLEDAPVGNKESLTRLKNRVTNGGARDVAEMLWESINNHQDRSMVMQHFLNMAVDAGVLRQELVDPLIRSLPKQVSNLHRRENVSSY